MKAVDGISFDLRPGERLGLVGESGSGKSTMALALMRLHKPPARIAGGEVLLDGVGDVMKLDADALAPDSPGPAGAGSPGRHEFPESRHADPRPTGRRHQNPRARGQPRRVGRAHSSPAGPGGAGRRGRRQVPARVERGHEEQRVAIAIGTSLSPSVIIADEPTSALDVVVQRQVMETLRSVQEEIGAAVVIVGHDMGLMAQFADRMGVMYAGKLVELAPVSGSLLGPPASLHEAADRERADHRDQTRAGEHSRFAAGPDQRAARLPLPSALSQRL